MPDFTRARDEMVARQIAGRGIDNRHLLAAMREVPREAFVPDDLADHAYEDSPLPIEADQTISQPYIVAMMIDAAEVAPGDKVLEIGAGSGYAAAVMGRIADEVIAIERHDELARLARERMDRLGSTMSPSSTATAPMDCRRRRRSRRSWRRRAEATCRRSCFTSSPSTARW